MIRRHAVIFAVVLVGTSLSRAASAQSAQPADSPARADSLAPGRLFTRWLFEQKGDSIFARMSAKAKGQFGSAERIKSVAGQLIGAAGSEAKVVSEEVVVRPDGARWYLRAGEYSTAAAKFTVMWAVTPTDEIAAFGVAPSGRPIKLP
ncbi:MAG: hypothetical protein ABJE47_04640 [bacterium]